MALYTGYSYTPGTSPWNKKLLIMLWSSQVGLSVAASIFGAALLPSAGNMDRKDGGDSSVFFWCATLTLICSTVISLGFTMIQVMHYRQNKLHPMWVLIMSCISATLFVIVMAFAATGAAYPMGTFERWEASEAVDFLAAVPYLFGIGYSSVVFHKFRLGWTELREEGQGHGEYTDRDFKGVILA